MFGFTILREATLVELDLQSQERFRRICELERGLAAIERENRSIVERLHHENALLSRTLDLLIATRYVAPKAVHTARQIAQDGLLAQPSSPITITPNS